MEDLRARIASGDLAPGAQLPTTDALAAQYEVGKTTVRQAIDRLIETGELVGHQGRGVFVPGTTSE